MDQSSRITRLTEYRTSAFSIEKVELEFDLNPTATKVRTRLHMKRIAEEPAPLVLSGEDLTLEEIRLDGHPLAPDQYRTDDATLTIPSPPRAFLLDTLVSINPSGNTELSGLYVSGGRFCTQCEAEGFRRITYFLDRPDVLTRYTVRMTADKVACPTLLSNGDLIEAGELADGRHFAVWQDPFPKPSYLFALVAGAFETIHDSFVTTSGRNVALSIHVDPGNGERVRFAMDALKRSMAWDERVFKREYDLSQFHIVAVRDFNAGAMENKSLNIFNVSMLLADSLTETDENFADVERVVAHEYFHNWTGNRITLRDWFQLCLKEGLTVYRDQEFTADENSRAVQRIKDVAILREGQFSEDAGPLAHPVRPAEFVKIDNFYTSTVYRKGAELVRVLSALLGPEKFDEGIQRYFDLFDGKAATVEDFIACFEHVAGRKLDAFFHWYNQAGTPRVSVDSTYDPHRRTFAMRVRQETPPTPGQIEKQPLPIPLRIGFLASDGRELDARSSGSNVTEREFNVVLSQAAQEWTFTDVAEKPIPAILRGFMAPVLLNDGLTHEERLVQMAHEPDSFTRWDAGQSLLTQAILARSDEGIQSGPPLEGLVDALAREIDRAGDDPAFAAFAISFPSLSQLVQASKSPDPDKLFDARRQVQAAVATALEMQLIGIATDSLGNNSEASGKARGWRALQAASLNLLASLGSKHEDLMFSMYESATNMTRVMSALKALSHTGGERYQQALARFEARWREQPLVMDKWFNVQARSPGTDAAQLRRLTQHELFSLKNPNRARSVFGAFGSSNLRAFHAADGSGYALMGEVVREIDTFNSMLASRLVRSFETWKRYDETRRAHAHAVLTEIAELPGLSSILRELVEKIAK
ncbi:MAG TPA: aminopeptidase N [Bradyrhizobium sp.]|nr:aminopeptidase N [Bradyrhizobium sp.]